MQRTHETVKTILVVEDFEDSRFMLKQLLELSGYRVLEAANGREAVELAESECPDLVLMDLSMPVLDGLSATRLIRRIESICHVPVVALTAHCSDEYVEAAREAGCDHFVSKPVDFDMLLDVIREHTEGDLKGAGAPPPRDGGAPQLSA